MNDIRLRKLVDHLFFPSSVFLARPTICYHLPGGASPLWREDSNCLTFEEAIDSPLRILSATLVDLVERTLRDLPKLRGPFVKKTVVSLATAEILAPSIDDAGSRGLTP